MATDQTAEYECDYVRAHSLDFDRGIGSVFVQAEGENTLKALNKFDAITLNPAPTMSDEELAIRTVVDVCQWQDWLSISQVSLDRLRPEQRRYVRGRQSLARRMNAVLLDHHNGLLVKRGYAS